MSDVLSERPQSPSTSTDGGEPRAADPRSKEQQAAENKLAERLSILIEQANDRVVPLVNMVRHKIEQFDSKSEDDRNEDELVKEVRPLLEEAEKVLNETNGTIKGADPEQKLSKKAKRNAEQHKASSEEQRLAAALEVMVKEVGGTIDWAKHKLESYPKAKKDLGPLLDALGQPLTQIVAGVGFLLSGVLNLLGNLLSGLGLNSLLSGIFAATGLQQIYRGLGLHRWLNMSTKN